MNKNSLKIICKFLNSHKREKHKHKKFFFTRSLFDVGVEILVFLSYFLICFHSKPSIETWIARERHTIETKWESFIWFGTEILRTKWKQISRRFVDTFVMWGILAENCLSKLSKHTIDRTNRAIRVTHRAIEDCTLIIIVRTVSCGSSIRSELAYVW